MDSDLHKHQEQNVDDAAPIEDIDSVELSDEVVGSRPAAHHQEQHVDDAVLDEDIDSEELSDEVVGGRPVAPCTNAGARLENGDLGPLLKTTIPPPIWPKNMRSLANSRVAQSRPHLAPCQIRQAAGRDRCAGAE